MPSLPITTRGGSSASPLDTLLADLRADLSRTLKATQVAMSLVHPARQAFTQLFTDLDALDSAQTA